LALFRIIARTHSGSLDYTRGDDKTKFTVSLPQTV
jgi:nitrogen-specific signal transduction histidine kinase